MAHVEDESATAGRTHLAPSDAHAWARDAEVAPSPAASSMPPRRVEATGETFAPTHEGALFALREVLLSEDDRVPPEAEQELEIVNRRDRASGAIRMGLGMLAFPMAAPLVVWMGVRDARLYIDLERRVFGQVWRLRNLLPEGVHRRGPPAARIRDSRPFCGPAGPTA